MKETWKPPNGEYKRMLKTRPETEKNYNNLKKLSKTNLIEVK